MVGTRGVGHQTTTCSQTINNINTTVPKCRNRWVHVYQGSSKSVPGKAKGETTGYSAQDRPSPPTPTEYRRLGPAEYHDGGPARAPPAAEDGTTDNSGTSLESVAY
eukprot:3936560-Rhodomonas_salina.1